MARDYNGALATNPHPHSADALTTQQTMAKKKSSAPAPTTPTPSASGARRGKNPGTAIDQSPLSPTTSQTSEEVLATANEMTAGTAALSTEGLASSAPPRLNSDGPSFTEIAEAAYRRYLQRGGTHGQDLEDWIAAERELRERRR